MNNQGKKRILFLDQSLAGGGAERVMCTVIRDLDPSKYDIYLVLISQADVLYKTVEDRVKVRILNSMHTRNAFFKFIKVVFEIAPDIIYTTTARTSVLAILACRSYRHSSCIVRFPTMPKRLKTETSGMDWRTKLVCSIYRKADYIIAQTDEIAEQLQTILKVDKTRIFTIQNPVDRQAIQASIINKPNPMDAAKINVVAAGLIYPLKGFDILIRAFKKVVEENSDFMLHILGRDRDGNMLKLTELAKDLGIVEHVRFHGFVENPYVYFKHCNVFVLSSRIEGMPNALLECLHLSKPVVATKCTPVIERLITSGKNGFVVEVDDVETMADAILHHSDLQHKSYYAPENGIVKFIDKVSASTKHQTNQIKNKKA